MKFTILNYDTGSSARTGLVTTSHGEIRTPVFMPVGTQATVKAVDQEALRTEVDAQIILGNTYHLYLRPGTAILEKAGGLHQFMNWERPILTDSGGFQVYSISENRKISEEGVKFKSHIDGSTLWFTPENVMDIQRSIGGDIVMAFDECTPYPCERSYAVNSMHQTHRWLKRCCARFDETEALYGYDQTLFPIVQGSVYPELRKESAEFIASCEREGNAIGGLSVGEPHEMMYDMTGLVCSILPKDKPRYLMGVGTPVNLLESVALGVDMFDCVMPTRNARNGMLFTPEGVMNMRNKKWEDDFLPVHSELTPDYSRAYLRHLFMAKEHLAARIASIHNLKFYHWLMDQIRMHIEKGDFMAWKNSIRTKLVERL